jgi:hypothetical protein
MSIDTLPPALWDDTPQIFPDDSPRARLTDPIQSHMAADRSQKGLSELRQRVLHVIAYRGRRINGNDLNDLFAETARNNGWKRVHPDSPRKRAGELAVDGYLLREATDDDPAGLYSITAKGLEALS